MCPRSKGKRRELSTPNLTDVQCMEVARHQKVKLIFCQDNMVIKCVACVGVQVDRTVSVF